MNTLPVTNPRTGEIDYQVPEHSTSDVEGAVAELRAAQPAWESMGPAARAEVILALRDAVAARSGEIGDALCVDTGRHMLAHAEAASVQNWMSYWAGHGPTMLDSQPEGDSTIAPSVSWRHELKPYPVVGIISPWNFPLVLGLIDAVPALLAGCSILLKPSEVTPRFAEPLARSIADVPEIAGVIRIVTGGPETGQALVDNVDAVCFTGSVPTGRKVAVRAAENFIPAFLELGGKDPAIVLPSADLQNAANAILRSAAGMTGQACQSLERIYVHESVFDEFLSLLVTAAESVDLNWPELHSGQIGPFIFGPQAAKVQEQLDDAVASGATVHTGGQVEQHGGWWCRPTVLSGVNHDMQLMREETFGPVLPVMPFSDTGEALRLANDSQYGLSGAVFAGDRQEAEAIARQIGAGAISINDAGLTAMVHDVEKNSFCQSGMGGSRMGDAGLMRFLRKRALLYQSAPAISMEAFREPGQ